MRKPKLLSNPAHVAKHSWSFRPNVVGVVLGAVELGMSCFAFSPPISLPVFAGLYAAVNLAGAGTRLIAQPAISGDA